MKQYSFAKFYDIDDIEIETHDTEDKPFWCVKGENLERDFIKEYGDRIGYSINPKKLQDQYVPDLISNETGRLADLKVQNMPFFKARELFSTDPDFTVVFNLKDREHYERDYPDIDIFYLVDWIAVRAFIQYEYYYVKPLTALYKIRFSDLVPTLNKSKIHDYGRRKHLRDGNAKKSYVFDIRTAGFEKLA